MLILVADDSRVMRQIVVRTLRQAGLGGHDIIEAADGRELVERVRSDAPDLVLSDWNMPELSGLDALRTVRAAGSKVPFVFVTSEGSEEMRAKAESAGAWSLIAKPFTPESFAEALRPIIGMQQ